MEKLQFWEKPHWHNIRICCTNWWKTLLYYEISVIKLLHLISDYIIANILANLLTTWNSIKQKINKKISQPWPFYWSKWNNVSSMFPLSGYMEPGWNCFIHSLKTFFFCSFVHKTFSLRLKKDTQVSTAWVLK